MSSSTSCTTCPQCNYAECLREYRSFGDLYLACPHCGYYESWVGEEHAVAPGAGCISYILTNGFIRIHYLPTTAEIENAAQWLRERLSTGELRTGYVTRWDANTQTVETVVGKFGNFFLEISGGDLDDLDDDQEPEPGDPHLDRFDTATGERQ